MRRRNKTAALLLAAALFLLFTETVFGWPWSVDMFRQASVRTFEEQPMAPPEGALAVDGEPPMDRDTAGRELTNPLRPIAESLERGRELFMNVCFPCHGSGGRGDGPVAAKFVSPADLTLPMYVKPTDGYIHGTIRDGGVNMPPQGTALSPAERWEVVNFVRSLQKR